MFKVKERKRKDKCRQVMVTHGHHLWILQQDLILAIFMSIGQCVGHHAVKVMVKILVPLR